MCPLGKAGGRSFEIPYGEKMASRVKNRESAEIVNFPRPAAYMDFYTNTNQSCRDDFSSISHMKVPVTYIEKDNSDLSLPLTCSPMLFAPSHHLNASLDAVRSHNQ
jgi:hypothetical protein